MKYSNLVVKLQLIVPDCICSSCVDKKSKQLANKSIQENIQENIQDN
jgi:hypothetical protein